MKQQDEPSVTVTVVRTGGIAGMRRQWRAAPVGEEAGEWVALIEQCPWDRSPGDASGADRFCWRVSAEAGATKHEADLPDADVQGPWRALIDAVRAWPGVSLRATARTDPAS
ncbi:protealysin inhibitor emfourin [Microbacterium sp. zg-YB36]|uniref:protealysin inhibitor emfourin n=1 Tax=Microbacterium sp. zg-YB36 TaxID=2969407 RepID=UPI00214CA15A|nr:protealysin inhibitor emfourin [Microbacterium sp. zg-YB36]MDL5353216.1 hypothetical protein [Microbacterium sp. zg-YB36]